MTLSFSFSLSVYVCVCVCMSHSGGRTITVTGQGFDLVQSVTMQVLGIGETVSNQLNIRLSVYYNKFLK